MGELTPKVIVITGASSGFGKGAALAFANKGASLVLAARRDYLRQPSDYSLMFHWRNIRR